MSIRIYGKRQIDTLKGLATRPTPSRVREAVFNIWFDRLPGAIWLDLCAGSGAMGAEALARGVDQVIGLEKQGQACRIIEQNWQKIASADQKFKVIKGDVKMAVRQLAQPFDLIYFDPPYQAQLYEPVLTYIGSSDVLIWGGAIAAEHHRDDSLPECYGHLYQVQRKDYGQTSVTFFERIQEE
ncbi:MAG: 16S rRNA (guanine(966)-N(2))-methyltransferase RsmD [Acaryochloridaceae cyanobacterium RL_2_7]|nr:16S rRNA (guanine(966)-N(2))-methyltransferase RsmD [Acaryochloridaceae cyanobacterium RL_2_7]